MLTEDKILLFKDLIRKASREEVIWLNAYSAGLLDLGGRQAQAEDLLPTAAKPSAQNVSASNLTVKPTVVYGTETGNSKKAASALHVLLKKNKLQAKIYDALQYSVERIAEEEVLLLVFSTQGEGELPQNALRFFEYLKTQKPDLSKTSFAVLGLGDTSYPLFCQAAEDLDALIATLGGKRLLPLQKADTDFKPTADEWSQKVLGALQNISTAAGITAKESTEKSQKPSEKTETAQNHKEFYKGKLKNKILLNDTGSEKRVFHLEIETQQAVDYLPGDALGVYPKNSPAEITQILAFFTDTETETQWEGQKGTAASFLENKNIKNLSPKTLAAIAGLLEEELPKNVNDLHGILKHFPKSQLPSWKEVFKTLNNASPRLYSIASSPSAHPGEIHLTVGLHTFKKEGVEKTGFCSGFLSDFPKEGGFDFYIHKNNAFRLPENDKNVILIGPGTGIAPFRSFLFERDAAGAEGKNWLLFGEQRFTKDFYYQTEIQEFLATGLLTKLNTAFSRDQKEKIYVQNRLKENAQEVFDWIENGGYVYICGQRIPMSQDVENTLAEIIAEKAGKSPEEAVEYLQNMEAEGRFLKDVY